MMTQSALDPRAPFVLDLHELGRRPGTMRRIDRDVQAPAEFGIDGVIGVPEGAVIELRLRLEAVMEGVLVSGTAHAPISGECARCLDPIDDEIVVDIQELFAYSADDIDPETDEAGLIVVDDLIDLEQTVRDAVVLTLPLAPVCRDGCLGLCSVCGARLDDDPSHQHETTDPRWAALAELLTDQKNESGSSGAGPTEEK